MSLFKALRAAVWASALAASGAVADPLPLMTGNDYRPFSDQNLPEGGMATDIVRTAFTRMGHKTDIVFRPWKRGMVEAQSGRYLATFPWAHSDEREADFAFSEKLYSFNQYFFTRFSSGINGITEADVAGSKLCLPIGYTTATLDDWVKEGVIELIRPANLSNCFQMLASGRADLIRVNDIIGWSTVDKVFSDRTPFRIVDGGPVRVSVQYTLFSPKHPLTPTMLPAFNAELEAMKLDGTILKIMEKHLK